MMNHTNISVPVKASTPNHIFPMDRPFFRWTGGKQRIIKKIIEYLPPKEKVNHYYEPFLGAGALFFATDFRPAFLGDLNFQLINLYEQVRDRPKELYDRIYEECEKVSEARYYKVRKEFNHYRDQGNIEQAVRFLFLNVTNYNGMFRVNLKGEYNVPYNRKFRHHPPSFERLLEASKRLNNDDVNLSTSGYESILEEVEEGDLVYLDPPYPPLSKSANFHHYSIEKFSVKEQQKLAEFVEELDRKKCWVMLSNARTPGIEELYSSDRWYLNIIPVTRTVSCKKNRYKVEELIICNYPKR